jgi:hypothetical protein
MAQTIVDKALDAIKEAEKIRKSAIDDLLKQKDEIQRKLRLLGYLGATGTGVAGRKGFCKLCNIAGHDARAHRFQGKNKKAFTEEDLVKIKRRR